MAASDGDWVEIMLVVMGTWCSQIMILIFAFAISHYSLSYAFVVYDLCTSSEAVYFYSIKMKVSKLPKEVIDGSRYVTLDLLGTTGGYVTRLVIPFSEAIRNKAKAERQEAVTVTFKVGRKRKLPDIGRIRVDHELWGRQIHVHYIDIKDLNDDEDSPKNCRVNIDRDVTMLPPAEVDVAKYQTDQVFRTSNAINTPGARQPVAQSALILPEAAVFFVFSVIVVMSLCFWLPSNLPKEQDDWVLGSMANGAVAGAVGAVVALLLMLLFKFALKRKRTTCGAAISGRFALMTVLMIIAIALTIASGIMAFEKGSYAWAWAVAIFTGALVILLLAGPIGFVIEMLSRKQATAQMPREESTQQVPTVAGGQSAASSPSGISGQSAA